MQQLRSLFRLAFHGALVAAAFFLIAQVMAGEGGTMPLPLGTAMGGIEGTRLGMVAGMGAVAAVLLVGPLRLLPEPWNRVLPGGLVVGALAVVAIHQSSLFVLHQAFQLVPERGFQFAPLAFGLPAIYALMLLGALGGAVLSVLLRVARFLPDLLTGFLFGAFGLSLLSGLPAVPGFPDLPWQWLVINGGWGWGTAFLLRPLALRGGE